MGLFGGSGKGGQEFDFGRAALAAFGAGPQLQAMDARRQQEAALRQRQEEAERAQAQRESLFNNLVKQGMDPGQAELAMTNPEAFGTEFNSRFRTREQGAAGGSVFTPNLSGQGGTTRMAPSRHEFQGSVFDVGGVDQNGQGGAVTPRHQGVQVVPLQPGGELAGVNSFTGREVDLSGGTPAVPPVGGPPPSAPLVGQPRAAATPYRDPVAELSQIVGVPPSSGFRTQGHQDALVAQGRTRARNSQHTERNAIDFPIPRGPAQQTAAARIRQRYPQARFEFEATNLHVTLPGWGAAPDISGSARRYPDRPPRRQSATGNLPRASTPAQVAALPPGSQFIAPDGSIRRKP